MTHDESAIYLQKVAREAYRSARIARREYTRWSDMGMAGTATVQWFLLGATAEKTAAAFSFCARVLMKAE